MTARERAAYARGLLAAARNLRRQAESYVRWKPVNWGVLAWTCRRVARWCERRARAVRKQGRKSA